METIVVNKSEDQSEKANKEEYMNVNKKKNCIFGLTLLYI